MTGRSDRQRVAISALAVGMNAQTGTLDALEVGALQLRAEQLLKDRDDPLLSAVNHFATMFELHRHNRAAWVELGRNLTHRVDVAMQPLPPGHDRSDIDA